MNRAELDDISSRTLAHYASRAQTFFEGTKDHDVSQNIDALLRHIRATAPFSILDFGCGPGRDLRTISGMGHRAVGLEGCGEFVGMVGDGINDILALKQADIGVAMNTGAAAARDVSDIVLLKDAFTYLPAASIEGDRIIYNIKRVSRLFLTKNIYTLFFILFSGFVGLEFPLSPRYITWIDLLTIGIPTTILTFMTPVFERQSVEHFLYDTTKFALVTGFTIAFFTLFIYVNFYFLDGGELDGKTAAVSSIVLMGLYAVFHVSSMERSASSSRRRRFAVWAIILGAVIVHVAALYLPIVNGFFGLAALPLESWPIIVSVSALGMWLIHKLLPRAGISQGGSGIL
ncbi:MAG: hypothetical protein B7X10_02145 [Burkholderiales bacterium 21-58-4]|nr:MAG: hypothetical protein B7X10_02145 [Burkholderiales bacterium 21-58-4]